MKAIFTSRRARVGAMAVASYLGLWGVTQLFGVPRVRAAVAREHLPRPKEIKHPDQTAESGAVAIAPFLIDAGYSWRLGPLIGEAGSAYYVWFGGSGFQIWTKPTLMR